MPNLLPSVPGATPTPKGSGKSPSPKLLRRLTKESILGDAADAATAPSLMQRKYKGVVEGKRGNGMAGTRDFRKVRAQGCNKKHWEQHKQCTSLLF